jgi:hypothetical protein
MTDDNEPSYSDLQAAKELHKEHWPDIKFAVQSGNLARIARCKCASCLELMRQEVIKDNQARADSN